MLSMGRSKRKRRACRLRFSLLLLIEALDAVVRAFTAVGDGVIIQRPVYAPFTQVIERNGRVGVNNALINNDGYYTIDFADFAAKAQ